MKKENLQKLITRIIVVGLIIIVISLIVAILFGKIKQKSKKEQNGG